jgi:hypothetical protein
MKIEIEVPLDPEEWEYVGVVPAKNGWQYYFNGVLTLWDIETTESALVHPCFRRRADKHAWKQNIKWPSVFKEGAWLARDEDGELFLYSEKPRELTAIWSRDHGGDTSLLVNSLHDLSFLPPDIWSCDWHDSLVQVRHGGEG